MPDAVLYPLVVAGAIAAARWPGKPVVVWLWRRNVADPLTLWHRRIVADELRIAIGSENGRGPLYPMVERVERKLDLHLNDAGIHVHRGA